MVLSTLNPVKNSPFVVADRDESQDLEKLHLSRLRPVQRPTGRGPRLLLKVFRDNTIDETAIMSHVLQSERCMVVSRLIGLWETPGGLFPRAC